MRKMVIAVGQGDQGVEAVRVAEGLAVEVAAGMEEVVARRKITK